MFQGQQPKNNYADKLNVGQTYKIFSETFFESCGLTLHVVWFFVQLNKS